MIGFKDLIVQLHPLANQNGETAPSPYLGKICRLRDPLEANVCRRESRNMGGTCGRVTEEGRTLAMFAG